MYLVIADSLHQLRDVEEDIILQGRRERDKDRGKGGKDRGEGPRDPLLTG